jgi:hypothetical protein
MRNCILNAISQTLRSLATRLDCLADRFAVCPDCGRNRYTGAPCVGIDKSPETV